MACTLKAAPQNMLFLVACSMCCSNADLHVKNISLTCASDPEFVGSKLRLLLCALADAMASDWLPVPHYAAGQT